MRGMMDKNSTKAGRESFWRSVISLFYYRKWQRPLVLLSALLWAAAWIRPSLPSREPPTHTLGKKLDYFLIEVNGERKVVRNHELVTLIAGDLIRIEKASLMNTKYPIKDLNIVGYRRPDGGADDRDLLVNTLQFEPKYSEEGRGEVYAVVATSHHILHGGIYLHIIRPLLRSLEVTINQSRVNLRDHEVLKVKASDLFKVEKIETNLPGLDDVFYKVIQDGERTFLQISRKDLVFAVIPMEISE